MTYIGIIRCGERCPESLMSHVVRRFESLITEVIYEKLPSFPARKRLTDKIVFIDVGASGGLQRKWARQKHNIIPVLLEPNPVEAKRLRSRLSKFDTSYVLEHALSDEAGQYDLHISRFYGCTSILEANMDIIRDYTVREQFEVDKIVKVSCSRYDELVAAVLAPVPDVIKIDIEGFESRALAGFGTTLHNVIGIETEACLYPIRKGQALLHDLIDQLAPFDLRLRRLEEVPSFDGDWICVNAFFTKTPALVREMDAQRRAKHDVVSDVFRVPR